MSEARAADGLNGTTASAEYTAATGQTASGAKQHSAVRVRMEEVAHPARDLVRLSETRRDGRRLTRYARLADGASASDRADEGETGTP